MLIDEGRDRDDSTTEDDSDEEGVTVEEEAEGSGEEEESNEEEEDSSSEEESSNEGESDEDIAKLKRTVTNQRESEKRLKAELRQHRERIKNLETLEEKNSELEQTVERLRTIARRGNFERDLRLPNSDLAWSLLSDVGIEPEYDEDDHITNLQEIRGAFKRWRPDLFGAKKIDADEREEVEDGPTDMNSIMRTAVGRSA